MKLVERIEQAAEWRFQPIWALWENAIQSAQFILANKSHWCTGKFELFFLFTWRIWRFTGLWMVYRKVQFLLISVFLMIMRTTTFEESMMKINFWLIWYWIHALFHLSQQLSIFQFITFCLPPHSSHNGDWFSRSRWAFQALGHFWGAQFSFLHLFVIPRFDVIAQSHSSSFSFFTSPFLSFCYWAILCQWALAEGSKFANFWNFNSLLKQKVGIFSRIYQLFFNYMNQHCLFILSCATFDTYWQVAN